MQIQQFLDLPTQARADTGAADPANVAPAANAAPLPPPNTPQQGDAQQPQDQPPPPPPVQIDDPAIEHLLQELEGLYAEEVEVGPAVLGRLAALIERML